MTDTISRSMMIRALTGNILFAEDEIDLIKEVIDMIETAPALDVAPVVHARWIDMQEDDYTEGMWRCSNCCSDRYFDCFLPSQMGVRYCPNCGAKMDGGDEA